MIPAGLQSTSWASALHTFYPSLLFLVNIRLIGQVLPQLWLMPCNRIILSTRSPDTETAQTGKPLDNPTNSTQMFNGSMAAVAGLVSGMEVVRDWKLVTRISRIYYSISNYLWGVPCVTTPLDFLDLHCIRYRKQG